MEYAVGFLIYLTDLNWQNLILHEIIVEPECCDGSDEYSGLVQCPNVCDVVEKTYRQKMKELADLHAMVLSNLSMMILYVMKFITKLLCDQ